MIAALGCTGRVGRHVAAALAEAHVETVALVRRSTADVPLPTRHADLADPVSMRRALHGVRRLLLLTPHGSDQDLHEVAAIDAAAAMGVQQIVKISSGTATLGPNSPIPTARAHWFSEQRLQASGIDCTILRPSMFQQGVLDLPRVGGRVVLAPLGDAPIAMVDVRDVADCAVAALLGQAPTGGVWHLTGPRGLTMRDAAKSLGARYLALPPSIAARGMRRMGLDAFEVDHARRMAAYFSSGSDGTPTDHVTRLTGREPRPFEELLDHPTTPEA